jgi:uncharacterized protein
MVERASPAGSDSEASCTRCGACCAAFRVSFYWAEAATRGLPEELTEQVGPMHACMAGTNRAAPHCAALAGTVGGEVCCTAYEARPSPCREVEPGDDKCRRARERHGLPALPA